uniref:F-BAR domain-containing protein n=1 Tax=Homalodisca liturata TaxID=320908 RepID=A0A1B6JQ69_9HEMI
MRKASKALRRSSIRLKSFSCGHSELNLIVLDMKEVRSAAKQFTDAQETVWKDLFKWASKERNEAIRESFSYLVELSRLWTEVQNEFIEQLNKFRYTFEMILEGEMEIDRLREQHAACEAKENKLKKDLQKAIGHNLNHQARQIEQKIVETKSTIKSTQIEISERTHENEGVKVIKLKEGLLKLSDSYIELAQKSSMIFDGKRNIAGGLPELEQTRGMHDVRYRGSQLAKQTVTRVKESVKTYKSTTSSHLQPEAPPGPLDCPPPYTTIPGPAYPPSYQNTVGCVTYPNGWSRPPPNGGPGYYDVPEEDYEQDIAGAIGGARI